MKTTIIEKVSGKVTMEVEVEASIFQDEVNKTAKKLAKQVNIPGFRKGKAPKNVLQQYIGGSEAICAEAVEEMLPNVYIKAIEQENIEPIDQPDIQISQYEEGKPLIFKATIPVKPDVELGEYKGLEIEHKTFVVSEKDVDDYLGAMQQRHAQMESVPDKALEEGDTSIIDFEGLLEGEPFEGGKGENYTLVIGSNTFIPGFEEQLIGMKPGEERDINVTFPEEYHSEDLKGKEVVFKVKLNEVKIKKIMPLDDEFAKDISEFETLEELKQDVENRLTEMAKQENEQQIRNKVLDKVAENSQVEPPEAMVERKIDGLVKEMEYRMGQQGLTMEQYLGFTNNTIEQIRETYKADAEKNVKLDLVLEAIMKKEDLQVSEEEINKELETIAENNKQSVEEIKNILEAQGNLDRFKENVIFNKTLNMIVESASIVEPKDDEKEDDEVKDEK